MTNLVRAILFAWFAFAPVRADTPLTERGAPVEHIQETTVGTLAGVDVGVANLWDREYVDGAGVSHTGLTARLDYDVDGKTIRLVVGKGSIVELGSARWEVVSITKTPGQNGSVALRPLTP